MIEYFKELFSKPVIMQTPVDKLVMCAIVLGGMALLFAVIYGCAVLYVNIQKRKEMKKFKKQLREQKSQSVVKEK